MKVYAILRSTGHVYMFDEDHIVGESAHGITVSEFQSVRNPKVPRHRYPQGPGYFRRRDSNREGGYIFVRVRN